MWGPYKALDMRRSRNTTLAVRVDWGNDVVLAFTVAGLISGALNGEKGSNNLRGLVRFRGCTLRHGSLTCRKLAVFLAASLAPYVT